MGVWYGRHFGKLTDNTKRGQEAVLRTMQTASSTAHITAFSSSLPVLRFFRYHLYLLPVYGFAHKASRQSEIRRFGY